MWAIPGMLGSGGKGVIQSEKECRGRDRTDRGVGT